MRNLMEPDADVRRPTLTETLWLAVFVVGFIVMLALLSS
jgi:hypothetical protein